MKRLRSDLVLWVMVFICAASMVLAGCGKKAAVEKVEKEEMAEKAEEQVPSAKPITEERVFYGFENDLMGWEIPAWAESKSDYVAMQMGLSSDFASEGSNALKVETDFPGTAWAAALVEIQQYLDISRYRVIRADIYLPADAPVGLKANLILTVGSNWKFVEMNQSVPLMPGEWATISASVEPGSYDWKRVVPDKDFAQDVRKIAVRIISNRKPAYTGPVYVDNIRVGR